MTDALVTTGLSRRYGSRWALRDCSLALPVGRIGALVGPNGAGKTTLLHLATGLLAPTSGEVRILGQPPADPETLSRVGFVAQDAPLYRGFTVAETLRLGRSLNARWDEAYARSRLERLDIPLDQRVGSLSQGQRAQVALALALGKRPELLLLDEPVASLDPLARREFLQTLLESVAEDGTTVLLSSHLILDLERACDYLILLSAARVQLVGDIDELLSTHRVLTGPRGSSETIAGVRAVVHESHTDRQSTLFVRTDGPILDPAWTQAEVNLEDLVLGYMRRPAASALPAPTLAHGAHRAGAPSAPTEASR